MNSFLARSVAFLNGALAVLIIFAFLNMPVLVFSVAQLVGIKVDPNDSSTAGQAVLASGIVGLLVAIFLCGFIGIFCSIDKSLRDIRNSIVSGNSPNASKKTIRDLAFPNSSSKAEAVATKGTP